MKNKKFVENEKSAENGDGGSKFPVARNGQDGERFWERRWETGRHPRPHPHPAPLTLVVKTEASSRGSFGRKKGAAAFPDPSTSDGICASSVIVHGYQCQELLVTTEDEYILSVQRIPEGRGVENNSGNGNHKQPVILQHGILVSIKFVPQKGDALGTGQSNHGKNRKMVVSSSIKVRN
ncbi:hypothetical protein PIB30_091779 [Stylosanthes scabra]|uniref:Partial AB-hydrolase lipase domain-containing protein n=1 Tax=Stylosanthes scabra TaxID=79078 RepID=A0ABU6ZTD3_9FABA|nr:hypothetical protein [Stylosanthes scabra]